MSDVVFEVIVNGWQAKSKSVKIKQLSYERKPASEGYGMLHFNSKVEPDVEERVMNVKAKLEKNPFVIEGLPAGNIEDCKKTSLKQVNIINCKGNVKVKYPH